MPTKQERLPGTEQGLIQSIVDLADELKKVRDERMALTKQESELSDRLISEMEKNKVEDYRYEDIHAWIDPGKKKVKVRVNGSEESEE